MQGHRQESDATPACLQPPASAAALTMDLNETPSHGEDAGPAARENIELKCVPGKDLGMINADRVKSSSADEPGNQCCDAMRRAEESSLRPRTLRSMKPLPAAPSTKPGRHVMLSVSDTAAE